eukprot:5065897-Pyramimonas_sp.AAC.1
MRLGFTLVLLLLFLLLLLLLHPSSLTNSPLTRPGAGQKGGPGVSPVNFSPLMALKLRSRQEFHSRRAG